MSRLFRQVSLLLIIIVSHFFEAKSQVDLDLKSSITSRHYWRGIMVSRSINYEGDLVLTNRKFKFGVWGGYAFDNKYSEFDFHTGYKLSENISFEIWDLYASRDRESIDDYEYFDFDKTSTNHLLDASIHFYFNQKFPLKVSWSTMVWGRDLDEYKNQNYSSYLELSYPIVVKKMRLIFYMGINVFENSLYGEKTNLVDIGFTASKDITLNNTLKIPIWARIAINPEAETSNFIIGINF